LRDDVVWLISARPLSGRPWVRRVDDLVIEALTSEAAEVVAAIGSEPRLSTVVGDFAEARQQWVALVDLARSAE
jgi:hypothetical protein